MYEDSMLIFATYLLWSSPHPPHPPTPYPPQKKKKKEKKRKEMKLPQESSDQHVLAPYQKSSRSVENFVKITSTAVWTFSCPNEQEEL